jgi:hypothetical protein
VCDRHNFFGNIGCTQTKCKSSHVGVNIGFIYFQTVMTHVICIYFVGLDGDAASSG